MALPARFERATCGLGNRRSIHLSYGSALVYRQSTAAVPKREPKVGSSIAH